MRMRSQAKARARPAKIKHFVHALVFIASLRVGAREREEIEVHSPQRRKATSHYGFKLNEIDAFNL